MFRSLQQFYKYEYIIKTWSSFLKSKLKIKAHQEKTRHSQFYFLLNWKFFYFSEEFNY